MLSQMTRRAHLAAVLQESPDAEVQALANILEPSGVSDLESITTMPLKHTEAAEILQKASNLQDPEYVALLYYLHRTGRPYRSCHNIPFPPNAIIVPPKALHTPQFRCGQYTFSTHQSHPGNSSVQFYNPLTHSSNTGTIEAIWRLPLNARLHTFLVIRPHTPLSPEDQGKAPFIQFPGLLTQIVDAQQSEQVIIIEPIHIITHLTTFPRPAGTYGIERKTLIICTALNRGRR